MSIQVTKEEAARWHQIRKDSKKVGYENEVFLLDMLDRYGELLETATQFFVGADVADGSDVYVSGFDNEPWVITDSIKECEFNTEHNCFVYANHRKKMYGTEFPTRQAATQYARDYICTTTPICELLHRNPNADTFKDE